MQWNRLLTMKQGNVEIARNYIDKLPRKHVLNKRAFFFNTDTFYWQKAALTFSYNFIYADYRHLRKPRLHVAVIGAERWKIRKKCGCSQIICLHRIIFSSKRLCYRLKPIELLSGSFIFRFNKAPEERRKEIREMHSEMMRGLKMCYEHFPSVCLAIWVVISRIHSFYKSAIFIPWQWFKRSCRRFIST